ncbi:hypothetical protein [Streptomyces sp. NPDC047024]|uniref:hypothetical protein n=1 Tax=Streptomyces sp. NPDC047024 TaxID=3155476 RepID=UPI0033E6DD46
MLDNAGHYPLEEPGLRQLRDTIVHLVMKNTAEPVRRQAVPSRTADALRAPAVSRGTQGAW